MIDKGTIDRVIEAAKIEEVVGDFVSLKRRGANYVACCPFHNEKTPSFSVSPAKGIFKCFGCGKAGNSVTFVMEQEHMSYVEAIKYLGRKYGIDVQDVQENEEQVQKRLFSESLGVVNEFARDFYCKKLWESEEGQAIGLSYFRERGFSDSTIRKFELGYAPDERRAFTHIAQKKGFKNEHLIGVGLTIKREETGELFDRFYERVMFPWRSISGKVIAFGGRILKKEKNLAKYVNSPESEIFVKNRSLYGIYEAKAAISRFQKCYLVEGYTDVISFHQAGVENVVASGGTSLTTGQIALIKRFSNRITVLYDGDSAGIKASLRGIDMLLEEGMEVKVALFPDGEDPDSYARKHTADELRSFLDNSEEDFISFKYRLLSADIDKDPLQRARLITDIVNSIAVMPDAITRNVYIEDAAKRLNVNESLLHQEITKTRRRKREAAEKNIANAERLHSVMAGSSESYRHTADAGDGELKSGDCSYLQEAEREIVYYLIKFGHLPIHLEKDFLYGEIPDENLTVSQYIKEQIDTDEIELQDVFSQRVYKEYFSLESADQERIMRYFVNHPEPDVARGVADLIAQPYTITVKRFKEALIPEENILGRVVPKTILVYKAKIAAQLTVSLAKRIEAAQREGNVETVNELMEQFNIVLRVKNVLAKELKRLTI